MNVQFHTDAEYLGTVSIFGLGKLGAPIAAAIASRGFRVVGVDPARAVVDIINCGSALGFEPGVAELMSDHAQGISATMDSRAAILSSQASFLIVPTPSDADGWFSTTYVLDGCAAIGAALSEKPDYHIVVITSTVMPGATGGEIRQQLERHSGKQCGLDFGLCYSPEFVALGSVIRDFLEPDFILIGESDPYAGDWLESFYHHVCLNNPAVARMSLVNAELAKISVNTFVTTKITFANMLADICERTPGADVDVVAGALGLDRRIGTHYLKGGAVYGGPCFPRDNVALAAFARSIAADSGLAEATDAFNRRRVSRLAETVIGHLPRGGTVGILGLAYKTNTDVVEQAQGLLLAQTLTQAGFQVVAYDPAAIANASMTLGNAVEFAKSAQECIASADVVFVAVPWEEFRRLLPSDFHRDGPPVVVIDCWRLFDEHHFGTYAQIIPVGVGPKLHESTDDIVGHPTHDMYGVHGQVV